MIIRALSAVLVVVALAAPMGAAAAAPKWVQTAPSSGSFALAGAPVLYAAADDPLVAIAARDLAADLSAVTGRASSLQTTEAGGTRGAAILVGTLGRNATIDALVKSGKLKVGTLPGAWESFVIATVKNPAPGIDTALVIAGSDRRGTAFGVYELTEAIGVSPWTWWADVPPQKQETLYVPAGLKRFGPPSVKYRGIFINDEDWGLQPWAARTFDPALGDIGPKTYEKVFQLLLRLKANTLWPAMHEVTRPFNDYPENAVLADRYGIVMGSSHAEPMLRNNVGEWKAPASEFNYAANRDGVLGYWRTRVKANGKYDNIYTLGMRGIHDSGMQGGGTIDQQRSLLEKIFADQRGLLAEHVNPSVEKFPQAFTAYKEVLDVYRSGLKVPEDVTLVWPDDNHGYIRQLPNAAERARVGGSGVYYHLSYLGAPLAHLWLSTVPPALIVEEMGRAYDLGARTLWIANVGDIKPAEINAELFLDMAWDVGAVRDAGADGFMQGWAAREFGAEHAGAIASILERHHGLNGERKPEHLQWWLQGQRVRASDLSLGEAQARLARFDEIVGETEVLEKTIAPERQDAFFQLVAYPVKGAALANHRVLDAEAYDRMFNSNPAEARRRGALARAADRDLTALTVRYNEEIAGGKWKGMMSVEPADGMWKSYRTVVPTLPAAALVSWAEPGRTPVVHPMPADVVTVQAEAYVKATPARDATWRKIEGLGRGGASMAAGPITAPSRTLATAAGRLDYAVTLPAGAWTLDIELIPTFPVNGQTALRLAASVDGAAAVELSVPRTVGDAAWSQGVLDGRIFAPTKATVCGGPRTVSVSMIDPGVTLDALTFRRAGNPGACGAEPTASTAPH